MAGNGNVRDRSPLLQGYGSDTEPVLPTRSQRTRERSFFKKSKFIYVVNAVAVVGLVGVCFSMHSTIARLEAQVAVKSPILQPVEVVSNSHNHRSKFVGKTDRLPMSMLPSKFAVDYVTPRQDQAHRGTCWDFATIGFLEQSYRENGVKNGWLEEHEYVAFSEQAYGAEILKLCTGPPDSPQQKDCRVAGDSMWMNSTEGGEVPELYYLREGLKNSVFPQAVCKYYTEDGNDTLCPGMEPARKSNPLKFQVKLLVGYNDAYLTRDGFTGGLIVKNSWADGPRQGSHSLAFWMQEVSDWEERTVCPNSYNPVNWYQCGNEGINSQKSGFNRSNAFNEGIQACLSEETKIYAETNVQPLHLKCTDPTQCKTEGDFTYFVRNTTDWGDRMTVMCLWEYSVEQHISREICLKPMLEIDIARTLRPVEEEVRENDTDRCGFYFIPYEALRHWIAQFQGFFVNSFDIEWDPQSYLANADSYPDVDYTLLKQSTKKQNISDFLGPFPYASIVKKFDHNTCRSPVAELFAVEWLKRRLNMERKQQEERGIRIHSAAITDAFDAEGSPASAHAVSVMREYNIDLSKHRSRLLTEPMCEDADYIVDVPDPWHMDYDTYMENVALMEELVSEFMEKTFPS
ncbi:hypothetical protein P43SY_008290 [Pythium insidiosum]|uniref:Phosphotyrosine protein phosphatase I domain-containing protein n=1 Tax=Pythium insidiosum TaxID=114742 RepID=A0AAD5M7X5_PYTIN|nr:hypothetical protein P43SY_008290 [Pythium insidiosum]